MSWTRYVMVSCGTQFDGSRRLRVHMPSLISGLFHECSHWPKVIRAALRLISCVNRAAMAICWSFPLVIQAEGLWFVRLIDALALFSASHSLSTWTYHLIRNKYCYHWLHRNYHRNLRIFVCGDVMGEPHLSFIIDAWDISGGCRSFSWFYHDCPRENSEIKSRATWK